MMLMTFVLLRQHVWLLTVQVLSFFPLPDSRRLAASEGLFHGAAQWMRLFFQSHPSIFELRCMYRFVGLYTRASVSILLTCQCLSLYRYLYLYISCSLYDQSTRKQSQTNKQEVRELVTRFDSVWWVLWQRVMKRFLLRHAEFMRHPWAEPYIPFCYVQFTQMSPDHMIVIKMVSCECDYAESK